MFTQPCSRKAKNNPSAKLFLHKCYPLIISLYLKNKQNLFAPIRPVDWFLRSSHLSWVPMDPIFSFLVQKSGELCRYTSSFSRTGRTSMSLGTSCLRVPVGWCFTLVADRYFVFRSWAISFRSCSPRQQVRMEQEPETPWHLHFITSASFRAWGETRGRVTKGKERRWGLV